MKKCTSCFVLYCTPASTGRKYRSTNYFHSNTIARFSSRVEYVLNRALDALTQLTLIPDPEQGSETYLTPFNQSPVIRLQSRNAMYVYLYIYIYIVHVFELQFFESIFHNSSSSFSLFS